MLNFISGQSPHVPESSLWGNRFEHFIVNELKCVNAYQRRKSPLNYWRSTSGFEVDLIFGALAIEIKSTKNITSKHLKGLRALREEQVFQKYMVISQDKNERVIDGVECHYYENALRKFWDREL